MSKTQNFNTLIACALATVGVIGTWVMNPESLASEDETAVREVIESAYFNGAFNEQNTDDMAKGFHEDFAIFSAKGEDLARYEIETWMEGIKERRAAADFDPKSTAFDGSIVDVDITGGAASAKIEFHKEGKIVFTDYISLLKFESGWKIAAKVYHRHE